MDLHPSSEAVARLDATGLVELLEEGSLTTVRLVEQLLGRIAAIDADGPRLSSVLALDPRALEQAARLDAERAAGHRRGPLHGLPVLVKDNIDTAGELGTTAGSLALRGHPPAVDAAAVMALRSAGALVLGKTNLSEWANFRSARSSSGWSAVGGQTRNPHALDRSPGGSSAGSGAAVAAGLAPLSVGTETDGSILCPAALCGVVGLKPTVGLVARRGVVPIARSQDSVGPIARSVRDVALLLDGLTGSSMATASSGAPHAGARGHAKPSYLAACTMGALAGARIGVPRRDYFGSHARAEALVDEALSCCASEGAELIEELVVPNRTVLAESGDELTVLLHEFKDGLERYLASRRDDDGAIPRTLEALIAFNEAHPGEAVELFGQALFERAMATDGLQAPAYRAALRACQQRSRLEGLDAVLDGRADVGAATNGVASTGSGGRGPLDVLAVPTMGPAWCIDHVNGDASSPSGYQMAAIAGYPALTLPVGEVAGLPVGICLIGRAYAEPRLLALAHHLETALAIRLVPSYRAHVPLEASASAVSP